MKFLTGFAVVNDRVGDRVTYTYDEVDEQGNVLSSNNRASFIAMDSSLEEQINEIKAFINAKLEG